ncbi:MAG: Hsp70 family protein, partial [Mycobacterium sp.]
MSDLLGLSIGTTNLVAACPGRQPVTRRSVLTLWDNRPPEVGVPSQNPELTSPNLTQGSLVLRGFVERVGDPVPLVAADGSTHRGEALVVMALTALARAVDDGIPPTTVVVTAPAHWGPAAIGSLRGALRESPLLSPGGLPPTIVSDATAALAALQADPGLPGSGVVALCDFGAGGTSITLADAGANLAPIGETVRFGDFSGDQIDRALLDHVLAGIRAAGGEDTAGTAAFGALTRLREECRLAKERLSFETTTALAADLPGFRSDIMVTRAELNAVIADPLTGFLDALGDALERNRIPATSLTAIGVVGGGSVIPAVSQRLSDSLQVPVIASPGPTAAAAVGAVMLAARGTTYQDAGAAPTGLSTTPADAPTGLA